MDELRDKIAVIIGDYRDLWADGNVAEIDWPVSRILAIPEIAEALAAKAAVDHIRATYAASIEAPPARARCSITRAIGASRHTRQARPATHENKREA